MSHPDPDTLAVLALDRLRRGDVGHDGDVREHISSCAACSAEFAGFARMAELCRVITPEDRPTPPPRRVWDRIAAELDLAVSHGTGDAPATGTGTAESPAAAEGPAGTEAPVIELAGRRGPATRHTGGRRMLLTAVAAAAVGVVGGVLATAAMLDGGDDVRLDVVASADLAPLPGQPFTGVANLATSASDGGRVLSVQLEGADPTDGFYEVWLLTPEADGLVALGTLDRANSGVFPLPESIDLQRYPVVDVSLEPWDGNPAHSTDSLVRGALEV